jgi:hypothetical protein
MIFLFVYHYYEVANGIATGISQHEASTIVGNVIELGFVLMAVCFFIT